MGTLLSGHKNQVVACNFCGKNNEQAIRMITKDNNVFICDECVSECSDILAGEGLTSHKNSTNPMATVYFTLDGQIVINVASEETTIDESGVAGQEKLVKALAPIFAEREKLLELLEKHAECARAVEKAEEDGNNQRKRLEEIQKEIEELVGSKKRGSVD